MPTIDPEFHALIPPLSPEERAQLEANIIADGCREALVTWDGILIDGHNRFEICAEWNIQYETRPMEFPARDDVKSWIIRNQFGRRNLSPFQRAELALKLEPLIAAKAKENQVARKGDQPGATTHHNGGELIKPVTRDRELAKISGVSHNTIHRVKVIAAEAPEELREEVRSGTKSIGAAYETIRHPERAAERQARAQQPPPMHPQPKKQRVPRCSRCHRECRPCEIEMLAATKKKKERS